jgi:hypothetical protein
VGKPPNEGGWDEELWINVCVRSVPASNSERGVRAVVKEKLIDPERVRSYLERALSDHLSVGRATMND